MYTASMQPPRPNAAWMEGFAKQDFYRIDMLALFPLLFTLVCCLLFLFPTTVLLDIGWDPIVAYWHPSGRMMTLLLVFVPLVIAGAHVIHVRRMMPVKKVVVIAVFAPAAIIIIMADVFYELSWRKAQDLADRNCDSIQSKRDLQASWEVAYYIYDSCLNQTNAASGYSRAQLQANFRLPDCEDYTIASYEHSNYKHDWLYLAHLEKTLGCSGWCYPGQQLWVTQAVKDDCSSSVANGFFYFVKDRSMQILLTMTATLVVLTVLVLLISAPMRSAGFDW